MNVLHLITSTRSFFEQQVQVLEDRGISCTVLGVPGTYRADSPRTPSDYVRYYPRVLETVTREDFDIVHAHYGLVSPFALAQPERPVVLSLWGTDVMSEMWWLRSMSKLGAQVADATILPSRVMGDALDAEYTHIPFGVDTDLFRPIPRECARDYVGWNTDQPIALFPYDPARAVKNYPLAERVIAHADVDIELRTLTDVPHEEMPYYLNASDLLLVTSHRESGPMTVKEATACNLPAVSVDVGFVREVIEDVRNCEVGGTPTELARSVSEIVADGRRSNGRGRVMECGLDEMGDRLVSLYRRVLDRPPGSASHVGREASTHDV